MENDWKNRLTLESGRYAKFHKPTKRWYLFDSDGNNIGSGRNIREVEEVSRGIK